MKCKLNKISMGISSIFMFFSVGCAIFSNYSKNDLPTITPNKPTNIYYTAKFMAYDKDPTLAETAVLNEKNRDYIDKMIARENFHLISYPGSKEDYQLEITVQFRIEGFRNFLKQFPLGPHQLWEIISLGTLLLIPLRIDKQCEIDISVKNRLNGHTKIYQDQIDYRIWGHLFLLPYAAISYKKMFIDDDDVMNTVMKRIINQIATDINAGAI